MQLPLGVNNAELEERIIQHLAAAAAMGRTHHIGRREGRSRSSSHGRPHFLVFSTHPGGPPEHVSASGVDTEPAGITVASPSSPLTPRGDEPSQHIAQLPSIQTDHVSRSASGSNFSASRRGASSGIRYTIVSKWFLLWLLCCEHFCFNIDPSFTESPLLILHLQIWIELVHPNFSHSQNL